MIKKFYSAELRKILSEELGIDESASIECMKENYSKKQFLDAVFTHYGVAENRNKILGFINEIFGVNLVDFTDEIDRDGFVRKKYNEVEISFKPDFPPKFTHSKILLFASDSTIEGNHNIDYFTMLMNLPYKELSSALKNKIDCLYSVSNMNYQICNGGVSQYFTNSYHKEKAGIPKHLCKDKQIDCLHRLIDFGKNLDFGVSDIERFIQEFQKAIKLNYPASEYEDDDETNSIVNYDDFDDSLQNLDSLYYEANELVEKLLELYAQYLIRSLSLEDMLIVFKEGVRCQLTQNLYFPKPVNGTLIDRKKGDIFICNGYIDSMKQVCGRWESGGSVSLIPAIDNFIIL